MLHGYLGHLMLLAWRLVSMAVMHWKSTRYDRISATTACQVGLETRLRRKVGTPDGAVEWVGGPVLLLRLLLAALLYLGRQLHPHLLQVLLLTQQVGRVSAVAVLLPRPGLRHTAAAIVRLSRAGAAAGGSELLLLLRGRRLLVGQQLAPMLHLRVSGEAETVQLRGLWAQGPPAKGSVAAVEMKVLAAAGAASPGPTLSPDIRSQLLRF